MGSYIPPLLETHCPRWHTSPILSPYRRGIPDHIGPRLISQFWAEARLLKHAARVEARTSRMRPQGSNSDPYMDEPAIDVNQSFFQQLQLPQQKKFINGVQFPTILSPNAHSADKAHLIHLTEAIRSHKQWLEDLLRKSGAILFRGFAVESPSDFNDVVEATGFPGMEYTGGGALRTQVFRRVFTANESPPDQHIAFHHEMAYAADFPSKLMLFCEVEPDEGGETPIVLSHIVYERMKQKHPEFVAKLEERGLTYTRIMARDDDPTSPAGRGWHSTFSTTDKSVAEQRAAKLGMKLEWVNDDGSDSVKILIGPKPAFRVDDERQSKTWFNSMVVAHGGPGERDNTVVQPEPVTFGDGSPLPTHIVYDCINILEEECVAIPWKKGDVLLIDNLSVLHSRRPIVNSQTHNKLYGVSSTDNDVFVFELFFLTVANPSPAKPLPLLIKAFSFSDCTSMDQPPIDTKKSLFQQVKLPQQKNLTNGLVFPTILSPNHHSAHLNHFTQAIQSHKEWLNDLLKETGAILFRGFPVDSPSDFNDVVEATGFPEMNYIGGRALRTQVFGRVYTANESPPEKHIAFHHEMATDFPSKVMFFCEAEPEEGGETPIVLSHIVYERMKEAHPSFVGQLEEHGLLYTKVASRDDDLSSPTGRGWQSTFSTCDKTVAEQRAAKAGAKLEWINENGSDSVKMVVGPMPAFRVDEATQRKTWFNGLVFSHGGPNERDKTMVQPEPVTFGDGKPLPAQAVYDCIKILEEECVVIPWKKGDVLLVDNLAVLHSRRPSVNSPEHTRRVLASLCNECVPPPYRHMDQPIIKETFFQQLQLPLQKNLINGVQFPTILSPNAHSAHLIHLTEAIRSHKQWLEDLLRKSGAILFRGFPVDSPFDFNEVIEATGFPEMEYLGGGALRTQVFGRVYTANESPPDQHIAFHHEMAYAADFPFKLLLFCEVEPEEGGETPIVLSHVVYERMKQIHPAFVARLEEHGLLYTRLLNGDDDLTSPSGRGWRSTFSTHDKAIAEQRFDSSCSSHEISASLACKDVRSAIWCGLEPNRKPHCSRHMRAAKMGMKLEWIDNDDSDSVKMIIGPMSAFRVDNARQTKTWFNSLVVAHGHGAQDNNTVAQPDPVTFGDGKSIPIDAVYDCIRILEEECVAIPWKKGDVLLVDNLAVLHSRRPCVNSQARSRHMNKDFFLGLHILTPYGYNVAIIVIEQKE
ncbi:hypothetical protein OSB04_004421 [Centaurea solstitialis]|uniref:TauD/TfdA-like domain-containing protein n=1 Tax=Centaurea solstitialis TaxID=347529 RepID=A0AA38TWT3_9ASTR|nr:hypothetical protein OSB04_004421 [Centaurea solstitialis]